MNNAILLEHLETVQARREETGKSWQLLQDKLAVATLPEARNKLQFELEKASLEKELAETEYLSAKTHKNTFEILQGMPPSRPRVIFWPKSSLKSAIWWKSGAFWIMSEIFFSKEVFYGTQEF